MYVHDDAGPDAKQSSPKRSNPPRSVYKSRETGEQHRIELEVAAGVMQHAYLLQPAGTGPHPAVIIVFYAPEVSVGYDGPRPLTGQASSSRASHELVIDADIHPSLPVINLTLR